MNNNEFDQWNLQKQRIHFGNDGRFYHEREIWWCALGVNIGFEQNGYADSNYHRPVLILKRFSKNTCLVLPLTTSPNKHHFRVSIGNMDNTENSVILSQMRTIDVRRLINRADILGVEKFEIIRKTIKDIL